MDTDKYWTYRPLLDLIGHSEGTDRGRRYNETLAYGAYTGGDVELVAMTLDEVDALQTRMLRHRKNKLKSSACGRYQIVRTTLRQIRTALGLDGSELFNADMQDRMACYLLGVRGIDKFLAGRLSEETMLTNLAKEWASLPTPAGKGYYGGQRAAVTPNRVRAVLGDVRKRHGAAQPLPEPAAEKIEKKARENESWWRKVIGFFTGGGIGGGILYGLDWQMLAVMLGGGLAAAVIVFLLRRQIVAFVRELRGERPA